MLNFQKTSKIAKNTGNSFFPISLKLFFFHCIYNLTSWILSFHLTIQVIFTNYKLKIFVLVDQILFII
jgi:hypothetical protein